MMKIGPLETLNNGSDAAKDRAVFFSIVKNHFSSPLRHLVASLFFLVAEILEQNRFKNNVLRQLQTVFCSYIEV